MMHKRRTKMNTNCNNNSYPKPVFADLMHKPKPFDIDQMSINIEHLMCLGTKLANQMEKENLILRRPMVQGAWAWSTPNGTKTDRPLPKRSKKYLVEKYSSDEEYDTFHSFDQSMRKVTRLVDTIEKLS